MGAQAGEPSMPSSINSTIAVCGAAIPPPNDGRTSERGAIANWILDGVHPRESGMLWVIPITSSTTFRASAGGKVFVLGSPNDGRSWQRMPGGLPERNAPLLVLREAMSVDSADPTAAYFGTSTAQLFCTRDEGGEWGLLADFPPPIYRVEAFGPGA